MLKVSVNYIKGRKTILEVSRQLCEILIVLDELNPFFSSPILKGNGKEQIELDISLSLNELVEIIAKTILETAREDILKYEKDEVINFDYSRDFGFSIMVQYQDNDKEITFTIKLGSSISNGLGILSNNGVELSYGLNRKILETLAKSKEAVFGTVKISDIPYLKKCKEYKYPLGICTFFSTQLEFKLPLGLSDMEYSQTENGMIISLIRGFNIDSSIVTNEEFDKLVCVMEDISKQESIYLKSKPA